MVKEGADQRCFLGFGASKLQGQQHSCYGGEVPEEVAHEKFPAHMRGLEKLNKLTKLGRCISWVHFKKIHFGKIQF